MRDKNAENIGEFSQQHDMVKQDISALQTAIDEVKALVEALPGGSGPCEVPPVWGKKFAGADRFVAVLDGAAYCDQETGLVWEGSPDITGGPNNDGKRTWASAINHCANRKVGGRKGWSLPMREQLATLVDENWDLCYNNGEVCLPDGHPFQQVQYFGYWSASPHARFPAFAWIVNFWRGDVTIGTKDSGPLYAWCVRGGPGL